MRDADLALRLSRPRAPGLVARRIGGMRSALCATPQWAAVAPATWPFVGDDDALAHTPQRQWLQGVAGGRRFACVVNAAAARVALE